MRFVNIQFKYVVSCLYLVFVPWRRCKRYNKKYWQLRFVTLNLLRAISGLKSIMFCGNKLKKE